VVVDGRGFDMTMTRRLQLAAEASQDRDSRLFLLRGESDVGSRSAAGTRWHITPVEAIAACEDGGLIRRPRWSVELSRKKNSQAVPSLMAKSKLPAGLMTAAEMFCNEEVQHNGDRKVAWTYEWNPTSGLARPVRHAEHVEFREPTGRFRIGFPPDMAHRPATATVA
jgi:hypothetical protein